MEEKLSLKSKIQLVIISLGIISLLGAAFGFALTFAFNKSDGAPNSIQGETAIVSSSGPSNNEEPLALEEQTNPLAGEENPSPQDDIQVKEAYEPGTYQVGKDMTPGVYKLISYDKMAGFYRISTNAKGDYLSIIDNDVFPTFTYVLLEEGQFLNIVDCTGQKLDLAQDYTPTDGKYISGKYFVGKDIPPGSYSVLPEGEFGYIEISPTPLRDLSTLILSKYVDKSYMITLSEGEYLKLSNAYIQIP